MLMFNKSCIKERLCTNLRFDANDSSISDPSQPHENSFQLSGRDLAAADFDQLLFVVSQQLAE